MTTTDPIDDGLTPFEREKVLHAPRICKPEKRSIPLSGTETCDPLIGFQPTYVCQPTQTPAADLSKSAVKYDSGKDAWHLLPVIPLREIIKLLAYGARKYHSHNWRLGFDYSRCYDALMRHLQSWWLDGENVDEESGCLHLAAVAFYALILIEFHITKTGNDDRAAHTSAQYISQRSESKQC